MSELNHTPAPWRTIETGRVLRGGRGPSYDVMGNCNKADYEEIVCSKATAADALLIAAAPELLAALQEIANAECSLHCPSVRQTGTPQPHTDACKRARAAIAKATKDEIQPES